MSKYFTLLIIAALFYVIGAKMPGIAQRLGIV